MCPPVDRRSFVASMAALVPFTFLAPTTLAPARLRKPLTRSTGESVTYVCPPCGLPCDKLTFDKPGSCPQCGMTLIPAGGAGIPTVAMLLYDGVEIIDIAGPWEALGMTQAQYEIARQAHGFTDAELASLARMSVLSSAAPEPVRARLLAGIDAWLDGPE